MTAKEMWNFYFGAQKFLPNRMELDEEFLLNFLGKWEKKTESKSDIASFLHENSLG